jgi:hypothetical protein
MPPKRTPAGKKTAPVAGALPVAPADEEPEHLCSTCGEMVDVIGETECQKCQTPPVVAHDEPSEDEEEEEEDMMLTMLLKQQALLTEQMSKNRKKHFDLIDGKVEEIENKREALKAQIRAYDEEIDKMKQDAKHKASEENKALQIKLDKVETMKAVHLGQKIVKTKAEHKSSAVKAPRSDGGKPYTKPTEWFRPSVRGNDYELFNTTTRLIFSGKGWGVAYCLVNRSDNQIYECDENSKPVLGKTFKTINDFCKFVKHRAKLPLKEGEEYHQNIYKLVKYYDIASQTYKSFECMKHPAN